MTTRKDQILTIDCDTDPLVPKRPTGWKISKHIKSGQFQWDPKKVEFYISPKWGKYKIMSFEYLYAEIYNGLSEKRCNANVLDSLLKKENQHFIPRKWRGKRIFFFGTTYLGASDLDTRFVRGMYWRKNRWVQTFTLLGDWNIQPSDEVLLFAA